MTVAIHHARSDESGSKLKFMVASGAWVMVKRPGTETEPFVMKIAAWKALPLFKGSGA